MGYEPESLQRPRGGYRIRHSAVGVDLAQNLPLFYRIARTLQQHHSDSGVDNVFLGLSTAAQIADKFPDLKRVA